MFNLVQSNCFDALHASISEASHRLQPRYRAGYVAATVRSEIRSAQSMLRKTSRAKSDRRSHIVWLLGLLGVQDASKVAGQIASAANELTVPKLEHLLLSLDYETAHQAIHASTQVQQLYSVVQHYVDAEDDAWRAYELYQRLRGLQRALATYISFRREISQYKSLGLLTIFSDGCQR